MVLSPNLHKRFVEQAGWTEESRRLFLRNAKFSPASRILEVGCGTGAVLASLNSFVDAQFFGVDIDPEMTFYARQEVPVASFSTADADNLPFPDDEFDAVTCHYLLLWLNNPETALSEFMRVTKPGGTIAIFAEPDYSHRIDYPSELERFGLLQRNALIQQGANPDIGKQIGELLSNAGCTNISKGILGAFNSPNTGNESDSEIVMLKSDISGMVTESEFKNYIHVLSGNTANNSLVQFIPTFFGWGMKPLEN